MKKSKVREQAINERLRMPRPIDIVCEGCQNAVFLTTAKGVELREHVFCLLLHVLVWEGGYEQEYPVECSAWRREEQKSE